MIQYKFTHTICISLTRFFRKGKKTQRQNKTAQKKSERKK